MRPADLIPTAAASVSNLAPAIHRARVSAFALVRAASLAAIDAEVCNGDRSPLSRGSLAILAALQEAESALARAEKEAADLAL